MLKALSLAALLALASPAYAQDASCPVTLEAAIAAAESAGIPATHIRVTDDIGYINDYFKALGVTIPDGSQPVKVIFVLTPPVAHVGIVEPNGCIVHHGRVSLKAHMNASALAAAGV